MPDAQKQIVQWFPGHMAKTRRQIRELLPQVDAVTELLDARIPDSSSNPEIAEIIQNKPRLILLNKCDLADDGATKDWIAYYRSKGIPAIAADCRSGKGLNLYRGAVKTLLAEKIKANQNRGMGGKALRVMVVGVPNTGKSSFINRMAKADKAKAENRAGVTKSNQWFAIGGGLELLDTPGVLWPKFGDEAVGDRLAFTGGIADRVLDAQTLAVRLMALLSRAYPDRLEQRYKMTDFQGMEPFEILEMMGRKRGMLSGGGEVDAERAAGTLLDEFKNGLLGRFTLELPGSIAIS